jgi:hypothetical protein
MNLRALKVIERKTLPLSALQGKQDLHVRLLMEGLMQTRQTGKGRPNSQCVEYDSDCSQSVRYFVRCCRVAGVKVELGLVVSGFWDEESDRRPLGGRILAGKSWDRAFICNRSI